MAYQINGFFNAKATLVEGLVLCFVVYQSSWVMYAKCILVEEERYYLTHRWEDQWVHAFL